MVRYISTRGDCPRVEFDRALLDGFAPDGGLYLPDELPSLTREDLEYLAGLSYHHRAHYLLRLFIPQRLIEDDDLHLLIKSSFSEFSSPEIAPVIELKGVNLSVQELFHGPTLSFKDIAMGFLINCLDYFLARRGEKLSLILATTGDTGPAAAFAAAGKKTLECWPLYPREMISDEQERQMTTLGAANVHPVGVEGCINGGDDLDVVVARLFNDSTQKEALKLSSVNSINWCRIMVQIIHYFSAYFATVDSVEENVVISVPTGAFGNLCAGYVAKMMGLPVKTFICANNANGSVHQVFSRGVFSKRTLIQTVSSAIDIVIPYNFWRFLYLKTDGDTSFVKTAMDELEYKGQITFSPSLQQRLCEGFTSYAISDDETVEMMRRVYYGTDSYLLDPHGSVAVAAAHKYQDATGEKDKIICLATAHPAKFPDIISHALDKETKLPQAALHPDIEQAKQKFHHLRTCHYSMLEHALPIAIKQQLSQ